LRLAPLVSNFCCSPNSEKEQSMECAVVSASNDRCFGGRPRPVPKKNRRFGCLILLVGSSVAACNNLQPLDRGAATPQAAPDPNTTPTTAILASDRPIGLSIDDETATTTDPCVKTTQDKTEILTTYCARCHSGPAEQAQGLPPWNFVLDDNKLIHEQFTREQQPPQRYVVPGDPSHSVLYMRVAVIGDMPPQPTDLGTPRNPAPTLSDFSVLRDWIEHCLPGSLPRGVSAGDGDGGDTPANPADGGALDGSSDSDDCEGGSTCTPLVME
jgi:hypothetical protein